ncbi:MAG: hypothetical protein A2158_02660 [Chloroflexi bacterium RBG_13_46_14]|nr:MAG: hypothetical protein A2158_02660 [Chloroflexi bacterium RBG_13_46_14]
MSHEKDREKIQARRIEGGTPNQESPPLGIGYLLAVAKQNGITAKFIDMVAEGMSVDELLQYTIQQGKPSLVGFTAYTIQVKAAGFIAAEIKKNFTDILVCCGGPHVTAMPRETLAEFPAFDFVVRGEGEQVIKEIFDKLKDGKSIDGIKGVVTRKSSDSVRAVIEDLDSLPFPAWEEFDLKQYPGWSPHQTNMELVISTSRGCPFSCIFCSRNFGSRRRHRSVASVIKEIERDIANFGCEALTFADETLTVDFKWSKEFLNTMISKGLNNKIKWACETRVDTSSPELFHLMKEAGCYSVGFGFESADDNILKRAKKGFDVAQIKKAVAWTKEAGLICISSFIIGLPGDTEESVNKTIKLAQELDIYSITFPIAVPLPGTELREMALKHESGLRILTNNWDDYGKQYPGVMESNILSIDRLRELQKKAYASNPKKRIQDVMR